jgi:hypothetical protein
LHRTNRASFSSLAKIAENVTHRKTPFDQPTFWRIETSHEAVDVTDISLDHFASGRTFLFAGEAVTNIISRIVSQGNVLGQN